MKKYIVLMAAALVSLTSCSVYTDVEAGGTAVEDMAGTWTVTISQCVDEYYAMIGAGDDPDLMNCSEVELEALEWEDMFGEGNQEMLTSNTAANVNTEMLFIDNYWGATFKCAIDYAALTFECAETEVYDGCTAFIKYGKIERDNVVTPSGRTVDSITAYIYYSDYAYWMGYDFTVLKISGYRYTGYTEDL
ncbi:MAG: lipid-binding protein [Rikenellaceae bacterium]